MRSGTYSKASEPIPAYTLFPPTPKAEALRKEVFSLAAHVCIDLQGEQGVLYRWKAKQRTTRLKLNASMEVIPAPEPSFDVKAYLAEAERIMEELKGHVRTKTLRRMRCKLRDMNKAIEKLRSELA